MNDFDDMKDFDDVDEMDDGRLRGQFEDVLAEFGNLLKQELVLDDEATVTFTIDDEIIVNMQYLENVRRIWKSIPVPNLPIVPFGNSFVLCHCIMENKHTTNL